MKALIIHSKTTQSADQQDLAMEQDFFILMNRHSVLESPFVYFSAGESRLKEILIQKNPYYSV